jgi:glutamate-5-semialdehyde dehydrogenase
MNDELAKIGPLARAAARKMAALGRKEKDAALEAIARMLRENEAAILEANKKDVALGREQGLSEALIDRLLLTSQRLAGMAEDVRAVSRLADPIGDTLEQKLMPNGLLISKRRVPIGVIGVIYESRPNVTVDISSLCLKSGNCAILRGGKEAAHSNRALAAGVSAALQQVGLPAEAVQLIQSPDRQLVKEMLTADRYIDMIIPRGGAGLHRFARENATIPVITGGIGICHIFVDESADLEKAVPIAFNAKVQRPTVCNAMDTLLVHREVAAQALPKIAAAWAKAGVEIRCCPRSLAILKDAAGVKPAGPDDYDTEFLALIAAVKVVDSLEEAIEHIALHSTCHSDAIITENYSHAMRFTNEVDSAAVYVNASTRFTDGSQFGLGAEVAISTQRLHARGPMGLEELTSYKWVIFGSGQVRE